MEAAGLNKIPYQVLVLGALSTVVHVCYVLFSSMSYLETRPIVDDSYYYFMIARNFWEYFGFTFDGINPTNGFQPLWQWMLLPFGMLSHDLQVRMSLLLAAACYQGAAWLLALWPSPVEAVRRVFQGTAIVLWSLMAFIIEYASSGMEFGLYLLIATWAMVAFVDLFDESDDAEDRAPVRWRRFLVATALLPLARVDGLGLSFFLWLMVLVRSVRFRSAQFPVAKVIGFGAASLLPFVLFITFNKVAFDTLLPLSGKVKRLAYVYELEQSGSGLWTIAWLIDSIKQTLYLLATNTVRLLSAWAPLVNKLASMPRIVLASVAAATALVVIGAGLWNYRSKEKRGQLRAPELASAWLALALFGVVQASVYSSFIPAGTQYAQWYYGPFYLAGAMTVSILLVSFARIVCTVVFLTTTILSTVWLFVEPPTEQIPTSGIHKLHQVLAEETQGREGVRVGSWNAGLVAFAAPPNVHVINLDGLVNSMHYAENYAVGADKRPYLEEMGIEYLFDYETSLFGGSWHSILKARLGPGSDESDRFRFTLISTDGLPPTSGVEQRKYHLLEVTVLPENGENRP